MGILYYYIFICVEIHPEIFIKNPGFCWDYQLFNILDSHYYYRYLCKERMVFYIFGHKIHF